MKNVIFCALAIVALVAFAEARKRSVSDAKLIPGLKRSTARQSLVGRDATADCWYNTIYNTDIDNIPSECDDACGDLPTGIYTCETCLIASMAASDDYCGAEAQDECVDACDEALTAYCQADQAACDAALSDGEGSPEQLVRNLCNAVCMPVPFGAKDTACFCYYCEEGMAIENECPSRCVEYCDVEKYCEMNLLKAEYCSE